LWKDHAGMYRGAATPFRHTSPLLPARGESSCIWAHQLGGFCVVSSVEVRLGLAIQCRVVL
jgi:hypothetical protein